MGILEPDDGGVTCIWGSSPDNIYFAGRGGTIAHYDGQRWQRIESGTDLNFRDIWGVYDRMVNKYEILALASTVTVNIQESRIFKIRNDQVEELDNEGLSPEVSSLWFIPNKRYYIVGAGIHQKRNLHDIKWRVYSPGIVTRFLSAGVRGSNINNVIVVGSFGEIVHFNGISWYNYYPQISLSSGVFGEVSVKNNIIVAVGFNSKGFGSYAVILIGRK
ncbi:MAG: hypothetical protein A4E59_00636 [Syntrophorhabdus sp. PtaB.Bin027]|nr:MAG: hypothetical protein A4E59_00636 [Syntrophorhabdus sp. PtaB.Bin027]